MSKKTRTHLHQDSIVLGNPFRIGGETSNTMLVQARPVIVGGALLSAEVAAFGAFLQKGEKRLREHHFRDRCKVLANINAAAHLRSVSAQGLHYLGAGHFQPEEICSVNCDVTIAQAAMI